MPSPCNEIEAWIELPVIQMSNGDLGLNFPLVDLFSVGVANLISKLLGYVDRIRSGIWHCL